MSVIEGKFGKEEEKAPTAVEAMETFLEQITRPAVEEENHEAVDVVILQLDDFGVSVGSNYKNPADLVLLLEMAKLSIIEQFMGANFGGGVDGTIH